MFRPASLLLVVLALPASGCALLPDIAYEPQLHNPFPQLHRVAILPFFNQSHEPTVDQDRFAMAYFNELQKIPGFEVVPVGVTKQAAIAMNIDPSRPEELRRLAQMLEVDAVVVGAITEYSPYYPPRLGLKVNWFAANPGFHPIPPGYGLPWGTAEEEYIPDSLVQEAEFALAREQLKTQTPLAPPLPQQPAEGVGPVQFSDPVAATPEVWPEAQVAPREDGGPAPGAHPLDQPAEPKAAEPADVVSFGAPDLPPDWPDPRGFVPAPPAARRPPLIPYDGPIITQTRVYNGHDGEFARSLANYYYFRDEARSGGWQAYLQRSDDFIRFCCYRHISEMLAARGGAGKTRVVFRWPIGRYER